MSVQPINPVSTAIPSTNWGVSTRWENLTFSLGCGYSGFLKVVGIAAFFWLVGFTMGRYWERSVEQKKNRQEAPEKVSNAVVPVAESPHVAQPPKVDRILPHGIKQSQVDACLKYIEKNKKSMGYDGEYDAVSIAGAQVHMMGETIDQLSTGIDEDGGRYDNFLGYLAEEGHIKKYVALRCNNIYIWL